MIKMKKHFTFTLDTEIVKQAKKLAIDKNTSLSALIEYLLKKATQENNKDEKNFYNRV